MGNCWKGGWRLPHRRLVSSESIIMLYLPVFLIFCPGYCQSVRVKVDFASWAKHRDLDETVGHAPNKKIGPLPLPKIPIDDNPVPIVSVNGCVVEDTNGVPLIYKITKVFGKHYKEISVSSNQSPLIPNSY